MKLVGELVIDLTPQERDGDGDGYLSSTVGYQFRLYEDGSLTMNERWDRQDEIFGSGATIGPMPPRVVREMLAWLASPS